MIISHRHKFIFLKTVKTGGTSVEIALSRYCGPEDVITPISPPDEAIRKEMGLGPQNHLLDRREYGPRDWFRLLVQGRPALRYWNHITAADIRDRVGETVWNSYFKFTIERNAWDKTISDFYWRKANGGPQSVDEYFRRYRQKFRHYNFPRYSINGQPAIDFVVRYEHLVPDLGIALSQVGIDFDGWLPHAKGASRPDRRPYTELLDSSQQRLIAKRFSREIALLSECAQRRAA
jgi:hypothetical protein